MNTISNSDIKLVKSLSQKKFRDSEGLFIVEGEKMLSEAVKSGFEVVKVFRRESVGEEMMGRLSLCASSSPVLAIVKKRPDTALEISGGLFLALDSVRDPGNLGTIIRIADWFGLDGIIASSDTVELYNPKVVQATMGAIFRIPFHYVDSLSDTLAAIVKHGGRVFGTVLDGENIYGKDISCPENAASVIVIGNESNGICADVRRVCTDRILIPPFPVDRRGSESLNAAIATAVTVAEFRRRQI